MDTMIYKCPVTGYHYDPLSVQRKLLVGSKGQVNTWLQDQRGEDELVAMEAEEKLLPVARTAFGFKEVDKATGLGEPTSLVLECLNSYLAWIDAKKVKGPTSPISSPCAGCP